ncbi:ATP-binding protein [Desulfallas thermosapovorans]|uniref:histidine kinase n=1 Tax=Desulfallas thermosapovorans DSM 6562 TaxID=1121431 RepID=A0A5S4ZXB2_9FIRM|nr:ATP-binding protein [Desulfallas thermosapovorans]TYO97323.1 signal transduction histidine kinase [Desulfallas thermosapovorans DSM 6562]
MKSTDNNIFVGFFGGSLRIQFLVIITILLIIPVLVILYDLFFASRSDEAMFIERKEKLGTIIDSVIIPDIKKNIALTSGNTNINTLDTTQRVEKLRAAFDQAAKPLVPSNPGVRFGLYIPETGQIFVHGFLHQYRDLSPEEQRQRERRILDEANSGLINVAAGGQPLARLASSLNDQTFEYLSPVYIDSQLVAVAWADQGVHPIFAQSRNFRTLTRSFTLLALMLSPIGALIIVHNLSSGVTVIKNGLRIMERDLSHLIPDLPGEAGEIARAVNKMAASLAEKEKLEEELRRSERLAALGRLVTGVAHELRNPIGVIKTTVQLMEKDFAHIDETKEYVTIINEQITRSNRVIQELLDFGKPGKNTLQDAYINALLERVLTFTSPMLRQQNIQLHLELDESVPATEVDAERIKQVFVNLILNATQAMPDGGTLTIKTYHDDKWVYTEFTDTGPGIEQADLGRIFDPFYTTKESGAGLGLSISHQIVRMHGGHITVDSHIKEGTTFTVQLPLPEICDLYK